jgi:hypothetical protein
MATKEQVDAGCRAAKATVRQQPQGFGFSEACERELVASVIDAALACEPERLPFDAKHGCAELGQVERDLEAARGRIAEL